MTAALFALGAVFWACYLAVLIAPHTRRQLGPASWPGRIFARLADTLGRVFK